MHGTFSCVDSIKLIERCLLGREREHTQRECQLYECRIDLTISPRFGATALALNLVPFVGLVFTITSTVGAALWANQLEKSNSSTIGSGRHVEHNGESAADSHVATSKDEVNVEF